MITSLCALHSLDFSEMLTELYREERGRKEIEVTKKRTWGVKRQETDLASDHFPKCSPQLRIPKEIHRVG